MPHRRRAAALLALFAVASGTGWASARPRPAARAPASPPLPAPDVHLELTPAPDGATWTMRIANHSARPARVPADARLLRLLVKPAGETKKKPTPCEAPRPLRSAGFPEERALILGPGEVYEERFDPRLLCFGKAAASLVRGAEVRASLGWAAPRGRRAAGPPFAVESIDEPEAFASQKELVASPLVLTADLAAVTAPGKDDASPSPPKEAGGTSPDAAAARAAPSAAPPGSATGEARPAPRPAHDDRGAPRLEVTPEPWVDAPRGRLVALRIVARNAGRRPAVALLRSRMFAFTLDGPDGRTVCEPGTRTFTSGGEGPTTLARGASRSITVLLGELCPGDAFARPGLYRVTPRLLARPELGASAATLSLGEVRAERPSLVRVHEGPLPFHRDPPRARPRGAASGGR